MVTSTQSNDNPSDDGAGSPGYNVDADAEFSDISHVRGIASTARKGDDINSASCQFFIMHAGSPFLDDSIQYSAKYLTVLL